MAIGQTGTTGKRMKIYVINLPSSVDRRENIRKQLDQQNVSYEIFQAVDGRGNPHPLFERYNDRRRKRYKRHRLSNTELGCYASHYLLWEWCVQSGEPVIVMEDDVIISPQFAAAADHIKRLIESYGWIRLGATSNEPFRSIARYDEYTVVRYLKGPSGAQCYALHPKAAAVFLEYSREWFVPVDDFMDKFWLHKIDCFGMIPYPVQGGEGNSTIVRDSGIYDSVWDRLVRRINRGAESFKRRLYNISVRLLAHDMKIQRRQRFDRLTTGRR